VTRRAPGRVVVEARAKLNLGLAVGPRRADGFHDLVTVFQSISLADTLVVEPRRRRRFDLAVRFEDASARRARAPRRRDPIPRGGDNLVLRAARLAAEALALPGGARFTLVKRIPAGAGMGGGSADAAATLVGLAAAYGVRWSPRARGAAALALGSDVPFALRGGTALGRGRGERLTRVRLANRFAAVVAMPEWRMATPSAYATIDRRKIALTLKGLNIRSGKILGRNRLSATSLLRLGNTFEEVLGDRRSDFRSLSARLRRAGALATRMTGSGSAVFGILGPGTSAPEVVSRFTGNEPLYAVRSTGSGLRLYRP
jgi:4-diphosphocytidyl-2-C-methyl-D-erythritol kinase